MDRFSETSRQASAHNVAARYLLAQRIASRYLQAEESLETKFDKTKGKMTITNPLTGRKIKIRSLRRHKDPKLRAMWKDEYDKWKDDPQAQKGGLEKKKEKARKALKAFLKGVKGVSDKMKTSLEKAPASIQLFVTDKKARNESLREAASSLKDSSKYIAKKTKEALLGEAKGVFVDTPKALAKIVKNIPQNAKAFAEWKKLPKEERIWENFKDMADLPTREELLTIYGTGVYVGGIALSIAAPGVGSGLAAAAKAGGGAFAHSFSLHVGIKAVTNGLTDQGFLGYEFAETGIGVASEMGLDVLSLPSSGALYNYSPWAALEWATKLVTGAEKDSEGEVSEDAALDKYLEMILGSLTTTLDKGIDDDEMRNILQEDHSGAFA